jgi:hypothetical protein
MAAVKVMAVGDSLTEYHAYRAQFAARVAADKADVTMVGPKSDATGAHAGFSGRAIGAFNNANETSTINGQSVNTSMAGMLAAHQPDVVLLMVGTNNMNHGLGVRQSNPPRYPVGTASDFAIAAEYAEPLNGSYLNGVGSHFNQPTFGTTYLKGEVTKLVNTVLDSSPTRKLIMAKIPPVGTGGDASATDPYAPGNPTRTLKAFNDSAVERIKEYNSYLDQVYDALPADKRARMRVIDNFTGVDRSYQVGSAATDFGPASRQAGDWVHPQPGAAAWTSMGDNFYTAYIQAAVPEPKAMGAMGGSVLLLLRRR